MYAQLCRIISEEAPNFESNREINSENRHLNNTFCRLLLAKCKDEFENRRRASEAFDNRDGPLTPLEEEQRSVAKHKMLGNIKFICELGKQNLLQESILHLCIKQLLSKQTKDQSIQEKAEDLECLTQIMKTVGRLLDNERAELLMKQYFKRMEYYSTHPELSSRIRFMLQDVLELRRNNWAPRRVQREAGPKTIVQIREEAAKDYGVYMPPHQYTFGPLRPGIQSKGGHVDVIMPYGLHLGTGPGAINDVYNHNPQIMGRRNPTTNLVYNNYTGYQKIQNNKRDINNTRQQQQQHQQQQQQQQQQHQIQQMANNSIVNTTGNRELPPRFQKLHQNQQPIVGTNTNNANNTNQLQPQVLAVPMKPLNQSTYGFDSGGISLRPAINSIVSKPNIPMTKQLITNSNLNNENNNINVKSLEPNSDLNKTIDNNINETKTNNIITNKSNKEVILKKTEETLKEFLTQNDNIDEIVMKFKEMKIPKNFQLDVLVTIFKKSLEASESERETSNKLLNHLKDEDVIGTNIFMNAFKDLINQMEDMETYIPRVKSHVAAIISSAIVDDIISLKEASEPLEGGQHFPLFLLCLQHLNKTKGQVWLFEKFTESKIDLIELLPENDRNKERMAAILEDRALGFLYPMLRIESDLLKQLNQSDCTPTSLYRWLKDNVDQSLQNNSEFIRVLFTCLLKYIINEASKQSISESDNQTQTQTNTTNIADNEKQLLNRYEHVLKAFLHEKHSLQLLVLYVLQSYWFNNLHNLSKGMILRWFLMLYDLEIVEEEVFIKWKEDINDEYNGKGNALFQVNQWLTWLEEAEEEDEDEDDDSEHILN
ncbi:eukaryotic translation initiation factor 4 gamma 2-like [Oppia nitens]|uniref:eukaryotic translation initiation factor 4 gamma 2-like n=1 Tax=Oppia nitens TaxID=1686743 RepID=UPI0023DC845F|nr:eukaryotic translation initiation factor 4 gamma 2-like [Oppia nitens]